MYKRQGGCDDDNFVEEAFLAWKVSSKKRIFIGKHAIKPRNAAKTFVGFRGRQLRSLQMHPAQYARLMSNSGMYILGPEMVASGVIPSFLSCVHASVRCERPTEVFVMPSCRPKGGARCERPIGVLCVCRGNGGSECIHTECVLVYVSQALS